MQPAKDQELTEVRPQFAQEWEWCGYRETTGSRQRYRLINREQLCRSLRLTSPDKLSDLYRNAIMDRLNTSSLSREDCWTECLAVGRETFVNQARVSLKHRFKTNLKKDENNSGGYILRESTTEEYTIA